jgi:hypothetical protein
VDAFTKSAQSRYTAKGKEGTYRRRTMTNDEQPERKSGSTLGLWIGVGVAIGAGIGVAMDNIAIGVGVGIALGVAIGLALSQRSE